MPPKKKPDSKPKVAKSPERIRNVPYGSPQSSYLKSLENDWLKWILFFFPHVVTTPPGPHHVEFWEWVAAIEKDKRPRPFTAVWPRGGGKSSNVELAMTYLAARRKRNYAVYVSYSQDQADAHVQAIADTLESPQIGIWYPDLSDRAVGKFGNWKGWRRNRLHTKAGFIIDALGLDVASRGLKVGALRPNMLCHAVGTEIYDEGRWMKVEEHPGLLGLREEDGLEIRVWGLPTEEIVTPEHRYWTRGLRGINGQKIQRRDPGWTEAKELDSRCDYIGAPIDMTVESLQPVSTYAPGLITERDELGRVVRADGNWIDVVPRQWDDPEWWWLIGLWWGDGHIAGPKMVGITVSDPVIRSRLIAVLEKHGHPWWEAQKTGCSQINWCSAVHSRWFKEWKIASGQAMKRPPAWVEKIDLAFQEKLMEGYAAADGNLRERETRITSVCLPGLLSARRIFARLGIAASIRKGPGPRWETFKNPKGGEYRSWSKQKYDIRFGKQGRYRFTRVFIEDGWLWLKVRKVESAGARKFAPITTSTHTYLTNFGLSHNCLDDIDDSNDSQETTAKKIETLTRRILPATTNDAVIIGIQNLIHSNSMFAQLVDGRAQFLSDAIISGPIPALEDFEYETVIDENGRPRTVITNGTPTWEGLSVTACQNEITKDGISVFLSELQHVVPEATGGMFDSVTFRHCLPDDVPELDKIVCWVDPAVTSNDDSDSMGIQIDGIARDGVMYRLFSWEKRATPLEAIKLAIRKAEDHGAIYVGIETDQGGDTWSSVFREARDALGPKYAHLTMRSAKAGQGYGSKVHRASQMLSDYERGMIVHVEGTHHVLEAALIRFPATKPYDLVDAAQWSWRDLRRLSRPMKATPATGGRSPARIAASGGARLGVPTASPVNRLAGRRNLRVIRND